MKLLLDLDALVKTLTDKGYDGYFHTESCCPGKLKDSISGFYRLGKTALMLHHQRIICIYLPTSNGMAKTGQRLSAICG